jgi:hypothetical protein
MNKRFGYILVLTASALAWVGCDNKPSTPTDAGCPDGTICLNDDAGSAADAGVVDGGGRTDGSVPTGCMQSTGRAGGTCRSGTTCGPGLTCAEELTRGMMGQFTLENIFEIPSAVTDPADPDNFLTEADLEAGDPRLPLPSVPIGFAPGGQCTDGCDPAAMADSCPACSTCTSSIGGSSLFGAVGISAQTFDIADPPLTDDTNTGICRADCTFDPDTNGGCQPGYTCDPTENVCLEACTADAQCNLDWGVTRRDGLVAVVEGTATCNTTTGRCEWEPPAAAAFGTECDSDRDCPADIGACIFGRCTSWQCNLPDASGSAPQFPCAEGAVCVQFPGNDPALCVATCETPNDCFAGQACIEFFSDGSRACWGICTADADCQSTQRCRIGGFTNPDLGSCQDFCTPGGSDCAEDEACVQAEGQTYGFCQERGAICTADADCLADEACEWLGNDGLARCVPGCADDTGCAEGSFCRIQAGGQTCAEDGDCNSGDCVGTTCAPSTLGVCRTPGGSCSPSPERADMSLVFPVLRGDGSPQCVPWQTCDQTMPDMLGTCVGDMPTP